jgi:hypothetical protein
VSLFRFRRLYRLVTAMTVALSTCGAVAALAPVPASAHVVEYAGPYTLEIGWQHEPTYVGEANGVQLIVHDAANKPVTDLKGDEVKVVVSTASQQSGELTFEPGFDPEEMEGPLGEYDAPILPTAPGDYTFHLTGTIHGTKLDITVSSGDKTFDTVKGTSDIQFPTKVPTLPEIVTRLDRVDARLAAAQAGPTQAAVDAAQASAADARAAADRALLVGGGLGAVGLVVGLLGVAIGIRAARRGRA